MRWALVLVALAASPVGASDSFTDGYGLVVESITFDPDPPLAGERFTVTVVVANVAGEARGPFDVRLIGNGLFGRTETVSLDPGERHVLVEIASLPERATSVYASVEVSEPGVLDRMHATRHREADTVLVGTAGLALGDVVLDPVEPQAGDLVTLRVTLLNPGDAPLTGASLSVDLDGAQGDPSGEGGRVRIPAAGAVQLERSWRAPVGTATVTVRADGFDRELLAAGPVTLVSTARPQPEVEGPAADLALTHVAGRSPAGHYLWTDLDVDVVNRGDVGAVATTLVIDTDGRRREFHDVPPLAAGENVTLRLQTGAGRDSRLTLDAYGDVPETDEANNARGVDTYELRAPAPGLVALLGGAALAVAARRR